MTQQHERECDLGGVPSLCVPCARYRSAFERGVAEGLKRAKREAALRRIQTAERFLERHPDNETAQRVLARAVAEAKENRP